jgi:hypothetical protein
MNMRMKPVALKVYVRLKSGMHMKDTIKMLIEIALETQVDSPNWPEYHILAWRERPT